MKKQKSKERQQQKGENTMKIEKIVTKSLSKLQRRSQSRDDKSSLGRSSNAKTMSYARKPNYIS